MAKQNWKPGNMLYPLPAVMVSCAAKGGRPNILTVAWCGTVCTNPAMVGISVRPGRYSYDIIRESREFVINLVPSSLAEAADFCGVRSGRDTDKFLETGLTPERSVHVGAPGIAECPVQIECLVRQVLPLGSHHLFLAEVAGVNVEESLMGREGGLDLKKADLIAYSHGTYFSLGDALGSFGFSVKKTKRKVSPGRPQKKRAGEPKKERKTAEPGAAREARKPKAAEPRAAKEARKPKVSAPGAAKGARKPKTLQGPERRRNS